VAEDRHFRRTARQPVDLAVQFRRDYDGARLELSGQLVDVGLGGVQIRCDRPPRPGERLRILLVSPSAWDPLELPGQVRWVGDDGRTFGVEFAGLQASEAAALYELLAVVRFEEVER
jgi:hypothetical protein